MIIFLQPTKALVLLLYLYSINSAICRPTDQTVWMPTPGQDLNPGQAVQDYRYHTSITHCL